MGKKYIIELEEPEMFDERKFYQCTQMPWWAVSENIVENLTPYTEPDLERVKKTAHDDGYSEGYQAGREDLNQFMSQVKRDYDAFYENGYEQGLSDAWEAARKICCSVTAGGLNYNTLNVVFGSRYPEHIVDTFTASEVIERLRQFEQKQEEELGIQGYFKNGEELIDANGTKAVILRVSEDNYCQVYTEKGCIENWHIHTYKFHKTGRYFPEIATVLEKMREGQDE